MKYIITATNDLEQTKKFVVNGEDTEESAKAALMRAFAAAKTPLQWTIDDIEEAE